MSETAVRSEQPIEGAPSIDEPTDLSGSRARWRALLRANAAVASDLSLPIVLRQIVSAARDLTDARYAALGVIGRDGTLEQFIHLGMDEDTVRRIGALPTGRGLLGEMIRNPRPLRLSDLRQHDASSGFPEHHPPMSTFLAVPIQVRDRVFGNLYVTECVRGEFTAEDEQLLVALASAAGTALENARLFQETVQHRRWLAACTEVTQQLFAGTTDQPLEIVLQLAAQGAEADLANLVLPASKDPADGWVVHDAVGLLADTHAGTLLNSGSLAWEVIESGKPLLVDDYSRHTGTVALYPTADGPVVVGSVACAPLLAGDNVVGVLCVGRVSGRERFTDVDMQQLAGFAGHVERALDIIRARADRDALARVEDRDRIATDLHDHVIQELFATGMGLEGMVHAVPRLEHQERLLGYVDSIDATIRRIRGTIFQLESRRAGVSGLRQRLLTVLDEQTAALGFTPDIEFVGVVDSIPPELADDVVAVVRKGLCNSASHGRASGAGVRVVVADHVVTVDIVDGVGTELHWTARLPTVTTGWR